MVVSFESNKLVVAKIWFSVTHVFFNSLAQWAVNSRNFKSILEHLPTAFHERGIDYFKTRKRNVVKEVKHVKSEQAFVSFELIQTIFFVKH